MVQPFGHHGEKKKLKNHPYQDFKTKTKTLIWKTILDILRYVDELSQNIRQCKGESETQKNGYSEEKHILFHQNDTSPLHC